MAFWRAAVWGVPLLLLLLAVGVALARNRVAEIGGLEPALGEREPEPALGEQSVQEAPSAPTAPTTD